MLPNKTKGRRTARRSSLRAPDREWKGNGGATEKIQIVAERKDNLCTYDFPLVDSKMGKILLLREASAETGAWAVFTGFQGTYGGGSGFVNTN